ncbi:hypothetical protein EAO18_26360 [Klebsiella pneumoniae]|nr:hypothetical protein EAO18_26360 [Klebsiella pneumoniae]
MADAFRCGRDAISHSLASAKILGALYAATTKASGRTHGDDRQRAGNSGSVHYKGAGLGLYGDFLFDHTRFGGGRWLQCWGLPPDWLMTCVPGSGYHA